jgi:site-specific recombinase XerD
MLNERQRVDYRDHRGGLVRWMLNLGKNPEQAEGYARDTVRRRACDIDVWYRYVWNEHTDGYTTSVTHGHADEYMTELAYSDYSDTHRANIQKSIKCYWRWQGDEWEHEINFSTNRNATTQPRDYFTREERTCLREASLEYGTVPSYNGLSPQQRRTWKRHLAQRFRKPMEDVGPSDFDKANGFKIPSLVYTSLDAALRPVEVGRARTSWVDAENALLRIPKDDSAKGRENWTVSIRDKTATMLQRWFDERECYEKYDETDRLWLTRESEPYSSRSLKYLLMKLCDVAGIDTENRSLAWYAIRHSTGTYMAREQGLAAAASQLRHKSVTTTRKYDAAPVDDRRDALDRMG